jgi:hypothetical protein
MVVPAWMHEQITAEEYDSWSDEQCAGIEIVDGMVVVSPHVPKRHNRRVGPDAAVRLVTAIVGVVELKSGRGRPVVGHPPVIS